MFETNIDLGVISFSLSLIALIFLMHKLFNINRLKIDLSHPRILVELTPFLIFLILGLIAIYGK